MILTKASFDILRKQLFGGRLSTSEVQALNFLVERCKQGGMSYPECAYALATVYHETDKTMLPIREKGSALYLRSKPYYPFIGYGYVQLTWRDNYIRVGKLIGKDLGNYPELALDPEIAAEILVKGMLNGWFTGLGFRRHRPVARYDLNKYISARQIINGKDRAKQIAEYAMIFEKALRS